MLKILQTLKPSKCKIFFRDSAMDFFWMDSAHQEMPMRVEKVFGLFIPEIRRRRCVNGLNRLKCI